MAYLWGSEQPPTQRQRLVGTFCLWLGGLLLMGCFATMAGATLLLLPDFAGFVAMCGVIVSCCLILAGVTIRFGGE